MMARSSVHKPSSKSGRQHWSYAFWVGLEKGQLVRRSPQAALSGADLALDWHRAVDHGRSGVSGGHGLDQHDGDLVVGDRVVQHTAWHDEELPRRELHLAAPSSWMRS